MPDSTGSEAAIAAHYVLQGRNGKARRLYHAAFKNAWSAEEVMTIFKNIFVHQAAETAHHGNVSGAERLHRFACQLWGETEMWPLLSAALIQRINQTRDSSAVWTLRSALIDCRPSTMSAQSAMHLFWKKTGIKIRRVPRPAYQLPVDEGAIFTVASEMMSPALN